MVGSESEARLYLQKNFSSQVDNGATHYRRGDPEKNMEAHPGLNGNIVFGVSVDYATGRVTKVDVIVASIYSDNWRLDYAGPNPQSPEQVISTDIAQRIRRSTNFKPMPAWKGMPKEGTYYFEYKALI